VNSSGTRQPPKPEALDALHQYLSDSIPPLLFVEYVEDLFQIPVRGAAAEVLGWAASQSHVGDVVTTSDYLFHAAKKLHLLAELELLPRERMRMYLEALQPILLESCPQQEQAKLARDLANLRHVRHDDGGMVGRGDLGLAGMAQPVAGRRGPGDGGRTVTEESPPLDRRIGLLLSMFERQAQLQGALGQQPRGAADGGSPAGPSGGSGGAVLAGILSEAASEARDAAELERSVGQLANHGIPVLEEGIVRMLGRSLPDWAAPPTSEGEQPAQRAVRAMHRLVTLAGDRQEKYKRFTELVTTAVEEFNDGSLGRAVTLFDLAGRMIEDEQVESTIINNVRTKAYGALDEAQLRRCADSQDLHYLFRRVMGFFPQLEPSELFIQLEDETSRDRRRLLLQLLSAQGPPARAAAVDALFEAGQGERAFPWFLERNLVYLMRTIPRPEDASLDREMDVLVRTSEPDNPLPLIREALATMGQLHHDRVVRTLMARVNDLEEALVSGREMPHTPEEVQSLLDTALTMLARTGTMEGRRCVVVHGLKRQPQLGNTLARLGKLAGVDLSDDATAVQRLVGALREELPTKFLGMSVGSRRKAEGVVHLVEALSGTDTPMVRKVLQEVADKHPSQPFGMAARRTLESMGAPPAQEPAAAAALAGDLALFGLPGLLQNMSDSQLTGVLTVTGQDGVTAATIRFDGGMIRSARTGVLVGEAALYQMLERPILGRFVFTDSEDESAVNMEKGAPKAVQPILFEGIRRYDELMRAVALAGDDARFRPTERKPTKVADEPNLDLIQSVWLKAAEGATPAECEAEFPVDSYRVRRLFEHWITEGSLTPRE